MIRSIPEPGDIGLTSIDGPVGWGIRLGQWLNGDGFGQYEHAFVVVSDTELVEAQPGGARIRPLSDYPNALFVSPTRMTVAQRDAVCAAARSYLGTPYSFADYAALAAHRFHLPLPGLRSYVASTGHLICSQLVDEAYLAGGVHLFADGRWPGYVTPADLYELLGRTLAVPGAVVQFPPQTTAETVARWKSEFEKRSEGGEQR